MSLNNKEIDLILSELKLEDFFIQKVSQPSFNTLVLYLYKREPLTLYICLEPGECRLHSSHKKIPKHEKPMRFVELLKSRICGARILQARQINGERIVSLLLSARGETYNLYIRLWSNAANIILTDSADNILDALYRRPKKGEISGGRFEIPPVKNSSENSVKEFSVRSYNEDLSFNEAIEKIYSETSEKLSRTALLQEAEKIYGGKIEKIKRANVKLKKKREEFLNAENLKHIGNLILTNLHSIKKGADYAELNDYENGGRLLKIKLEPLKTPQENAAVYYGQYKKAVSGLQALTEDIEAGEKEIEVLKNRFEELQKEENLILLQRMLQKEKQPEQQRGKNEKNIPGLRFIFRGWTILAGRTAAENDELLRRHTRGSDVWLHTRDYAGGYVFIKAKTKQSIPLEILIAAGNLAVFYSKARKNGEADLYKTEVKNLRRAKNAPKGTVLPSNEKNIFVKLDKKILAQLEECKA